MPNPAEHPPDPQGFASTHHRPPPDNDYSPGGSCGPPPTYDRPIPTSDELTFRRDPRVIAAAAQFGAAGDALPPPIDTATIIARAEAQAAAEAGRSRFLQHLGALARKILWWRS